MPKTKLFRHCFFLLLLILLALVFIKRDALFSMSVVISRDNIQARIMTSKHSIITRNSRGGDYDLNQYHLTLLTSSGQPFHYKLDDSLLRGQAPIVGEWLWFIRLRHESGAYDYFIDQAKLEQRLITGPELQPDS